MVARTRPAADDSTASTPEAEEPCASLTKSLGIRCSRMTARTSSQPRTGAASSPEVGDRGTGTSAAARIAWQRRLSNRTARSPASSSRTPPRSSRTARVNRAYQCAEPSTLVGSGVSRSSRSTSGFSPGESSRTISPGAKSAPPARRTSAQGTTRGAGSPAARTPSAKRVTLRFSGLPTTAKRTGGAAVGAAGPVRAGAGRGGCRLRHAVVTPRRTRNARRCPRPRTPRRRPGPDRSRRPRPRGSRSGAAGRGH
ncbi:hypothetical protein SHIRM173S_05927 [Streptomyces hirsutus]